MQIFEGDRSNQNTFQVESPQVSIIVTNCNTKYLTEAIDSVLEQTYKDYEIIIIDDNSTNQTKEVIESYLNNIRYIEGVERDISAAKNHGIKLAKGELIAFLDANDLFLPDKLEEQVAIFEAQPNIDIVNSGYRVIKDNGNMVMDVERWHEIPELTPEAWLLDKPVFPSAIMFRRACFDRFGGFQQRFTPCEDLEITLRMVIKGCQSTWLPKVTVCYRLRDCSANSLDTDAILTQLDSAAAILEYLFSQSQIPQSIRRLENKSSFYGFASLAWLCYQSGLYSKMVEYLEKSRDYVSFSESEMIDKWMNTFVSCAQTHACNFDANALNNLEQWQEVVTSLQTS
jgi:glycosyltransferase involved in cell wall biosynthesis